MADKRIKIHTVQLHLGDLLVGTQHMDSTEYGAYVALFLACYSTPDNYLVNNDRRLARIAKCTPRSWARVRDVVMEKFVIVGDFVTHNRVLEDAEAYHQRSQTNQANALKRWETEKQVASESQSERIATQYPIPNTHNPGIPEEGVLTSSGGGSGFDVLHHLDDDALQRAKQNAPGWDIYNLARIYNDGINAGDRPKPDKPGGAFPAWCKKYTKGKKL